MKDGIRLGADDDWELSEEYYDKGGGKDLSLKDFLDNTEPQQCGLSDSQGRLVQTAKDVGRVLELTSRGKTTADIAEELSLDRDYVYNIQVCAQGLGEGDEMAIAHLVMME